MAYFGFVRAGSVYFSPGKVIGSNEEVERVHWARRVLRESYDLAGSWLRVRLGATGEGLEGIGMPTKIEPATCRFEVEKLPLLLPTPTNDPHNNL